MRECINCIYSKGLGSDVWCEHNPKGKESYILADYDKMLNENGERAIRYKYCVNSR